MYEGLCYERLTGIAQSAEQKQAQLALGERALNQALALHTNSSDYSPAMPYQVLASLYSHVNDFRSVLDSLKKAREMQSGAAESAHLDQEIQSVEQYLVQPGKMR